MLNHDSERTPDSGTPRRLEQFQLLAARRAKSSAKGDAAAARAASRSSLRIIEPTPGDDFRYLDLNLYGRLERLFLKLYEEEANCRCASSSMQRVDDFRRSSKV